MQRKGRGQGRGQIRCREGVEQVQSRAGQGRSKWAAKVGQVWGGQGGMGKERCRAGGDRGRAGAEQGKERCREGAGQGWSKWADQGQDRGAHPCDFAGFVVCSFLQIRASLCARWVILTWAQNQLVNWV